MEFRHELKHEINYCDFLTLSMRLPLILTVDPHSIDGIYKTRTLYFDTPGNRALHEKLDGVNRREKFRIRIYNGDDSFISLEKKSKLNGLCNKVGVNITPEETEKIIGGDILWMRDDERELLRELYFKMTAGRLSPKTVVEYTRKAFIFPAGNVRVTLDYDIRTGLSDTDLLKKDPLTVPAGDSPIILEVKWDGFLPDIVRDAVSLDSRHASAFSKYAQCRIYG